MLVSVALSVACGEPAEVFTVSICEETAADVTAVEVLVRRPEGFVDSSEFTIREGAFIGELDGPFGTVNEFELHNSLGTETVIARATLADGCQLVSREFAITETVELCRTGTPTEPTLALGDGHTCALFGDGSVRCFGENTRGQLGSSLTAVGDMVAGEVCPVPIPAAIGIAAAEEHTCALFDSGEVRCWGYNGNGRLGLGKSVEELAMTADPITYPPVGLADRAVEVVAGSEHTCAVLDGRERIQCWGDNSDGQLGVGHDDDVGDDERPDLYDPVDLGGMIIALGLGEDHTCALLDIDGGEIRCWGAGAEGQLGYGDNLGVSLDEPPVDRDVDVGGDPNALAVNYRHSCAIRQPAGEVVCWGNNTDMNGDAGYLGYGDTTAYGLERPPNVALDLPGPAVRIAVGNEFSCALLASDELRCWGRMLRGRLGVPDHDGDIVDTGLFESIDPVSASRAGESIESLFAGRNHACIIASEDGSRRARCWGEGLEGQLGTGTDENIGRTQTPLVGNAEFELQ